MSEAQFGLTGATGAEAPVVTATGDIDLANVNEFQNALTKAANGAPALTVDLSRVSYCDSSAVRALFLGAAISVQHRGVLAEPAGPVGCPHPPFTRRLDITEPDRGGPGADQDRGAQDPHLARGEGTGGRRVLRGRVDRPQLQPGLPQHGPGPRAGGHRPPA